MSLIETCVVKNTPESDACGGEVCTHLTISARFDSDERFDFLLPLCEGHYKALLTRYVEEMGPFSIGYEE